MSCRGGWRCGRRRVEWVNQREALGCLLFADPSLHSMPRRRHLPPQAPDTACIPLCAVIPVNYTNSASEIVSGSRLDSAFLRMTMSNIPKDSGRLW